MKVESKWKDPTTIECFQFHTTEVPAENKREVKPNATMGSGQRQCQQDLNTIGVKKLLGISGLSSLSLGMYGIATNLSWWKAGKKRMGWGWVSTFLSSIVFWWWNFAGWTSKAPKHGRVCIGYPQSQLWFDISPIQLNYECCQLCGLLIEVEGAYSWIPI